MYRNLKYFILAIVFTATLLVSIGTVAINKISWETLLTNYKDTKENQVDYFINKTYEDLNSLLKSQAVWTDTSIALKEHNSDWLYDNATGYIVDDKIYDIDFIYITTEDRTFAEAYGENYKEQVTMTKSFTEALHRDEVSEEIIWINEKPVLMIASPIFDNRFENPTGCYIIGRKLDKEELKQLQYIFGEDESGIISITKEPSFSSLESNNYKEIRMSFPIELQQSKDYINVVLKIPAYNYIFNIRRNELLIVLLVIAVILVVVMLANLKKIVNTLVLVINGVEEISNGNYKKHIEVPKSSIMPELKRLANAVNTMSMHIKENTETIGEQINIINYKYHEMIELIVNAIEMNDTYTYHHSISVAKYAFIIGQAIGYKDLETLELTAKLHDIGKIGIPTQILNKPGSLTNEEYEIIKKHPMEGYKLVNKIEFFKGISEGIRHHHERYDGNGYPEGLKGDDIPLIAQIISIADVYDALTSDRSYRMAMTCEDAMKIILEGSGKMFNEKLVNVFYEEIKKLNINKGLSQNSF